MSTLLEHCKTIYNKMAETATVPVHNVELDWDDGLLLWEGQLTRLFEEVGLGQPYYSSVVGELKRMDCIRQAKRGGGPQPSKWLLLQEPTEELFTLAQHRPMVASRPSGRETGAQNAQNLRDLNHRITALETWARTKGYAV